ncbi:unknown [Klebsiella variicola CAG:634]|nr:unknown [Klebsiella variicola CAG:634]
MLRQLLLQQGEEALLLRLAARAGIDPHHHQIPRAGQSEAGIVNHHMVGFVFVNNLVAVAFRYLEGTQHGAMGGIQQGSDLLFRTAFNQVKCQ